MRIAKKYILPELGDLELASLSGAAIEKWLQELTARGFAPSSCNRFLATLKTVCSLAAERDIESAALMAVLGAAPQMAKAANDAAANAVTQRTNMANPKGRCWSKNWEAPVSPFG